VEVNKTNNAVFSLNYHLIICIKYGKKIFANQEIINDLKNYIEQESESFDVKIIEQECGEDHIHIIFSAKPTLDITKFINCLKGHSSRKLRKKYNEFLQNELFGDAFWSPSYFLATAGNVSLDMLINYVENQRK
jgi:putative transposase